MTKDAAFQQLQRCLMEIDCRWYIDEFHPVKSFIDSFKSFYYTLNSYPDAGNYPNDEGFCYFSHSSGCGYFIQGKSDEDCNSDNTYGITGYEASVQVESGGKKSIHIHYHTPSFTTSLILAYHPTSYPYWMFYFGKSRNGRDVGGKYHGTIYPEENKSKRLGNCEYESDDGHSTRVYWDDDSLVRREYYHGDCISERILERESHSQSYQNTSSSSSSSSGCVVAILLASLAFMSMSFILRQL